MAISKVTSGGIAADIIDGTKIADNAVDTEHLADDAVDSAEIAAGAVDNAHLATGIDASKLTTGTIPIARIANDAIDSIHYAAGSIDNEHLAANSVDSDNYVDDSIDAAHLANSINTDIATGVTAGTTASAALPKAGGTMSGALVVTAASGITVNNNASSNTDPSLILTGASNVSQDNYIQMAAQWTGNPLAIGMDNSTNTFRITRNSSGNLSSGDQLVIDSGSDVFVSSGDLIFSTAGKGICLGVTSNTDANTLDDYEEGTWTPTATTATGYTTQQGTYTKIGNTVHIRGLFRTSGTSSAHNSISGLPFSCSDEYAISISKAEHLPSSVVEITMRTSSTSLYFMTRTAASTGMSVNPNMVDGTALFQFAGYYQV